VCLATCDRGARKNLEGRRLRLPQRGRGRPRHNVERASSPVRLPKNRKWDDTKAVFPQKKCISENEQRYTRMDRTRVLAQVTELQVVVTLLNRYRFVETDQGKG
jgi:hypothetical protein